MQLIIRDLIYRSPLYLFVAKFALDSEKNLKSSLKMKKYFYIWEIQFGTFIT